MASTPPRELEALLQARDDEARDEAWSAFLETFGDLLLRVARSFGGEYDAAMDRYRYILERLRAGDYARLRSYTVQPRSRFRSWLVVVSRRLCYDHARARYGRRRPDEEPDTGEQREVRRRLADLAALQLKDDLLPAPGSNPERHLREAELAAALEACLEELPPRDRLLLRLRFEDDLPVRQVAEILDLPSVFHVYRRLKRVTGALRAALHERGVDDASP